MKIKPFVLIAAAAFVGCLSSVPSLRADPVFTPGITEAEGSTYTPTHYVDFENGDEGNSGTSPGSPWKYAPGMPNSTHTATAGNVIALKRGSTWRMTGTWTIGQSGSSGNPIVYTAYGTGALPKYTVLEDHSSGWTLHSGSVYKKNVSGTVERVYVNEVEMGEAWSDDVDDSVNWVGQTHIVTVVYPGFSPGTKPSSEHPDAGTTHDSGIIKYWKHVDGVLYLYSPGGDPDTLGNSIEVLKSGINFAINVANKSYVLLDRIAVCGGMVAAVNFTATDANTYTDLGFTNGVVKCVRQSGLRIYVGTTGILENGVIKWNAIDSGNGPNTKPCPDDELYGYSHHPFPGESSGSDNGIGMYNGVQNWTVAQNDISNFWHTQISVIQLNLGKAGVKNNLIEHNFVHAESINYAHGIAISAGSGVESEMDKVENNTSRYNYIYHTSVSNKHEGKNTRTYGNLVYKLTGTPRYSAPNISWSGDAFIMRGGGVSSGGVFAYNTIVDAAGAGLALHGGSGAIPTDVVVANNIFAYCGSRREVGGVVKGIALMDRYTTTSSLEVDNNTLFHPTLTATYEHGVSGSSLQWSTVAQMEAGESTWDDNSAADPQFTNYGAGDLTLASSSPARGAAKDISSLLSDSSGWVDMGCWQVVGTSTFVTGQTLSSTSWNGYDGWKGMKITVGSVPIVVTDLGRWVLGVGDGNSNNPGNSQTHAVKLVDASGTTLGSVDVATSGAPVEQFKYAALATPVTLSANTIYYVVSQETDGGDYWWGSNTTLSHTSAATVNNAVRSLDSETFADDNTTTDSCNVPLSFRYYVTSTFVTGQTLSSNSYNGYTGWKGMKITVGATPIIVTELGRWVLGVDDGDSNNPGNSQTHAVAVVDASGTILGSVSVATSGATTGQIKYVALATPVVLSADTIYYVMSQETDGGDYWWGYATTLNHTTAATINNAVHWDGSTFTDENTTTDSCNVPLGFKYY